MTRFLLLTLLLMASATASAIAIRHDVDDSEYRIPASAFPALVDMPGEAHGVLVVPQLRQAHRHDHGGAGPHSVYDERMHGGCASPTASSISAEYSSRRHTVGLPAMAGRWLERTGAG